MIFYDVKRKIIPDIKALRWDGNTSEVEAFFGGDHIYSFKSDRTNNTHLYVNGYYVAFGEFIVKEESSYKVYTEETMDQLFERT